MEMASCKGQRSQSLALDILGTRFLFPQRGISRSAQTTRAEPEQPALHNFRSFCAAVGQAVGRSTRLQKLPNQHPAPASHLPLRTRYRGTARILPSLSSSSDSIEQLRQTFLQSLGNLLDIHQRNIPNAALDSTVVSSVQPATLCGFFLIDFLFLADAADGTAKSDANVERHHAASCRSPVDAYTPYESHSY